MSFAVACKATQTSAKKFYELFFFQGLTVSPSLAGTE